MTSTVLTLKHQWGGQMQSSWLKKMTEAEIPPMSGCCAKACMGQEMLHQTWKKGVTQVHAESWFQSWQVLLIPAPVSAERERKSFSWRQQSLGITHQSHEKVGCSRASFGPRQMGASSRAISDSWCWWYKRWTWQVKHRVHIWRRPEKRRRRRTSCLSRWTKTRHLDKDIWWQELIMCHRIGLTFSMRWRRCAEEWQARHMVTGDRWSALEGIWEAVLGQRMHRGRTVCCRLGDWCWCQHTCWFCSGHWSGSLSGKWQATTWQSRRFVNPSVGRRWRVLREGGERIRQFSRHPDKEWPDPCDWQVFRVRGSVPPGGHGRIWNWHTSVIECTILAA